MSTSFTPYLEQLRSFSVFKGVRLLRTVEGVATVEAIATTPKPFRWRARLRAQLGMEAAEDLAARLERDDEQRSLLCLPYVGAKLGDFLTERDIDYVDLVGNIHLRGGDSFYLHIAGKKPPKRVSTSKGIRTAGFQVLFALLVRPDLASASARALAAEAGVSKSAVAEMIGRLTEEGWLAGRGGSRKLLRPNDLISRWVEGWATIVRPRLLIGRYAIGAPDSETLESKIFSVLGSAPDWAFGGGAAAKRLSGYFRGRETVIHVARPLPALKQLPRELGAVPSREGALSLFHAPGTIGLGGPQPHVAHPLLVYAELLAHRDERSREAASKLREQFFP